MSKINTIIFLVGISIAARAQKMIHEEILGRPGNHTIEVQAFFDTDVWASIIYGHDSLQMNSSTAWQYFKSNDGVEIQLQNLDPNSTYFYRLAFKSSPNAAEQYRPIHSFVTQKSKGSKFTFVVQADPHMDEQSDTLIYQTCLRNQLEDKPDFMIDLGDIFMSDKLKNTNGKLTKDTVTFRCKMMRSMYERTCHSVPLFMAMGNHEGEAGWNLNGGTENVAVWGTTERKKYFLNPYPSDFYSGDNTEHQFVGLRENYYSWVWGDALFIVLDPYWYTKPKPDANSGWRWTLGKNQYDWLKSTLENSDEKYKFVFAHQLVGGDPDGRGGIEYAHLYEWGGKNKDGSEGFAQNRPGWDKPIVELLKDNKVSVFFHGHDHFFGKQEKDCLVYQEVPQPSHPNFSNANQAAHYGYFLGEILPNAGHIRVSVDEESAKIEYVRAYKPSNETNNRKNKDVSATYFIQGHNACYDTLKTSTPIIWNVDYIDEVIYPNPSHQALNIQFNIPNTQKIDLTIFDENGQLIKHLINDQKMEGGRYNVVWDGTNNTDQHVASGVYFYRLSTQESGSKQGKIYFTNQ